MVRQGRLAQQIADSVGVNVATLRRALRRLGVGPLGSRNIARGSPAFDLLYGAKTARITRYVGARKVPDEKTDSPPDGA